MTNLSYTNSTPQEKKGTKHTRSLPPLVPMFSSPNSPCIAAFKPKLLHKPFPSPRFSHCSKNITDYWIREGPPLAQPLSMHKLLQQTSEKKMGDFSRIAGVDMESLPTAATMSVRATLARPSSDSLQADNFHTVRTGPFFHSKALALEWTISAAPLVTARAKRRAPPRQCKRPPRPQAAPTGTGSGKTRALRAARGGRGQLRGFWVVSVGGV